MTIQNTQDNSEVGEAVTSRRPWAVLVLRSLIGKPLPLACSLGAVIGLALPVIPARAEPATPHLALIDARTEVSAGSSAVSGSSGLPKGGDAPGQPAVDSSIRPFQFHATDEQLIDLRRRIAATRWPSRELVTDASQGVQLATVQELARYWQSDYDWRKFEKRLNSLPQFVTRIDGVDIHFIHVRSKHPKSLPIIITHGWPGSILEQLKIIQPLTNPTTHGGSPADARGSL